MEEKVKSFPLVAFMKEAHLIVNLLSFFYDQEREIYHVGKSQVIFRNTRYKVQ